MEENKQSDSINKEETQADSKIVTPAAKKVTVTRKPTTQKPAGVNLQVNSKNNSDSQQSVGRRPAVRKSIAKPEIVPVPESTSKPEEIIETVNKTETDENIKLSKKNLKKLKKMSDKAKAKEKEKKAKEKQKEKEKKARKKKKEKAKKEKAKKKLKEKKAKKKAADKKKSKKKSKKK